MVKRRSIRHVPQMKKHRTTLKAILYLTLKIVSVWVAVKLYNL